MILTAIKPVNARLGRPSVNCPNPTYLKPGEKITVKRKAWGDAVNNNNIWILSDESDFYSSEGFELTGEFQSLPIKPPLFDSLEIPELWKISKGEGINIGIIDSGVNEKHDSIKGRVLQLNTHSVTNPSNHGTTMACISAGFDENKGKIGVAPLINKIYSYQIDIDATSCNIEAHDLLNALEAMEKENIQVINMSFTCIKKSFLPTNNSGKLIQDKINALINKDVIIICATGNDGRHVDTDNIYPAQYKNVVSVTGYNSGENIDVDANCWDGVTISMSKEHYFDDEQFEKSNGTSSACAIISGCIACAYNKINSPKYLSLGNIFTRMPIKTDSFNTKVQVPIFKTNNFINLLNNNL